MAKDTQKNGESPSQQPAKDPRKQGKMGEISSLLTKDAKGENLGPKATKDPRRQHSANCRKAGQTKEMETRKLC